MGRGAVGPGINGQLTALSPIAAGRRFPGRVMVEARGRRHVHDRHA